MLARWAGKTILPIVASRDRGLFSLTSYTAPYRMLRH